MLRAKTLPMAVVGMTLLAALTACTGYVPRDIGPSVNGRVFRVGETVQMEQWRIKVHRLVDPLKPTNPLRTPQAGQRWVRVDVEMTNISAQTQTVAALLQFELQDDRHRSYDVAVTGEQGPDLDGHAPPGKTRRGVIDFEVATDSSGLTLNFTSETFDLGMAVITLG